MHPVHFSSAIQEWETPQSVFDALDAEFGFTTDVCACAENAKCERYFTAKQNALNQVWKGACWMNPPYGIDIWHWVRKALVSSVLHGATVVCLLPARTDTSWWHDFCVHGEVRFIRGRLKFTHNGNAGNGINAPFPSAIVIFRPKEDAG